MRIATQLKLISILTLAAIVVLVPVLYWSLVEFRSAKNDYALADAILANFFERASFRDRYFLYHEDRVRAQWDKNKELSDQLLNRADVQFKGEEDRKKLRLLRRYIEDTAVIFHRVVNNTGVLNSATANRPILQELDIRLSSQLLLKAVAVRDTASALKEASSQRVEQTYQYLTVTIGLFALTLALAIILSTLHLGRLIRKRLAPLHDGAKIVAGGNLDFRINIGGLDEFGELALSINNMTDKLQSEITANKKANEKIVELNRDFVNFLEQTSDFIYFKDKNSRFRFCSQTLANITGHASWRDMIGKHDLEVFPKDTAQIYYEEELPIFREGKPLLNKIDPYYNAAGEKGWVSTNKWPLQDHAGRVVGLFGISRDITVNRLAESELRIAATAFEAQEGITVTDETGKILRVNSAFTRITGYAQEEAVGQNPRLLKSGRHDEQFYSVMWRSINNTGSWQGEIWNRRKNGEVYPEYLTITAVKDTSGTVTHYVATFNDITLSKAAADEVKHLAFYDPLTRLPNRRLLLERLQQAFVSSARSRKICALLFIDLDNFKMLNDTLGHDVGDLLLQQVGHRLEACVREKDTVARIGGDEFVVILEELCAEPIEAATQTESVGVKILNSLNLPYRLGKHEYRNTPSIGATLFSAHEQRADELFKQADIAMYQAKNAGRNTLRFFDQKMQTSVNSRAAMEADLRKAITGDQFHLHYQIQVDQENRPVGAEALIRWWHPQRGLLSPAEFIPLAEESGLIQSIGQWVIEMACAQLKTWEHDELTRNLVLSVNVSAQQFRQNDFATQVQVAVLKYRIKPKLLKLELTESLLQESVEATINTMNALKEAGVQFSLDDFGTGYSSLQYLKRLPLDQLKIDQSFVRDLTTDASDKAIVRTIIAMAKSLNLEVIAEGVETQEQRQMLLANGCTQFQGFLFGIPEPAQRFEMLLKASWKCSG